MWNEIREDLYNFLEISLYREFFNEITFKIFEYDEYYN
jgi:hypothetical protein